MLGMGIGEILIVAIVAVIVLGPDKLPSAMVNIAKFFKIFKQTINGAKSTFEQEIKIAWHFYMIFFKDIFHLLDNHVGINVF